MKYGAGCSSVISSVLSSMALTPSSSTLAWPLLTFSPFLMRVEDVGVLGARLRVHQPLEREDEITGRDRIAVGPLGIRPQLERIGGAVVVDRP